MNKGVGTCTLCLQNNNKITTTHGTNSYSEYALHY